MKIISLGFKFRNVMSQDLEVIKMISNSVVLANAHALQLVMATSAGGAGRHPLPAADSYWFGALRSVNELLVLVRISVRPYASREKLSRKRLQE